MGKQGIWLVANWKMNGTKDLVQHFCSHIDTVLKNAPAELTLVLCPPFPLIPSVAPGRVALGAQNCHQKPEGAMTGEVSAAQLKDTGCRYVIVGHSERRAQFAETDAIVAEKAKAAIAAGLTPIICVGESDEEYKKGATAAVLGRQLAALEKLNSGSYLIAYEPVWAIGSGKTPSAAEISAAHREIKTALGSTTSVLYGGSVKSNNLREILGVSEVAGALIGGASLDLNDMEAMVNIAAEEMRG